MDWKLVSELAKSAVSFVIGVMITRLVEKKPKLVFYVGHTAAVAAKPPEKTAEGQPMRVHTHSVVVRNQGKKPAINVRLGHNFLPDFSVYPSVTYQVNEREIIFPVLVPREQVTLTYLYFPPVLWSNINTYTKSDEGFAQPVVVAPTRQLKKWQLWCGWFLIILGASDILYVLYRLLLLAF